LIQQEIHDRYSDLKQEYLQAAFAFPIFGWCGRAGNGTPTFLAVRTRRAA
jgi:hypothetical protein